ncbi:MAG: hypothetical protein OXF52_01765 [Candidatus Dadabacteria bacterium]|nr:hypothetical protein [Candidatus Dadabacteria bacterium]
MKEKPETVFAFDVGMTSLGVAVRKGDEVTCKECINPIRIMYTGDL